MSRRVRRLLASGLAALAGLGGVAVAAWVGYARTFPHG